MIDITRKQHYGYHERKKIMYKIEDKGQWEKIIQEDGPVLGISKGSATNLIEEGGKVFKDLNGNGKLEPYEDWRLPLDVRIEDRSFDTKRAGIIKRK